MRQQLRGAVQSIEDQHSLRQQQVIHLRRVLAELDPHKVLARGYALIRGDIREGQVIEIEKSDILVTAEVQHVIKK